MTTTTIEPGITEPIRAYVTDTTGAALAGLTNVKLSIQRRSDDFFFDWSDDTFKTIGSVTTKLQALAEVDAVNSEGWYRLDKAGHVKGFNTATIVNAVSGKDNYMLTVEQDGAPQNSGNLAQVGELKVAPQGHIVMQGYSFNPTTDVLTGNIWIEHDNIIVAAPTSCSVDWRDQAGVLLFTITDLTPDAQGFFEVTKSAPGIAADTLYYAEASVVVPLVGTVKGGKASFTFGA